MRVPQGLHDAHVIAFTPAILDPRYLYFAIKGVAGLNFDLAKRPKPRVLFFDPIEGSVKVSELNLSLLTFPARGTSIRNQFPPNFLSVAGRFSVNRHYFIQCSHYYIHTHLMKI